jgi:hypothetical protein
MLKPRDLASVASKLQVPLIVSDILNGTETFSDETEYALHEAISEMQPDSALLCIALCGTRIAGVMKTTATRVLEMECRKIIDEYALLWLQNAEGGSVNADEAYETLCGTQEDLEYLAGLFENCTSGLERKSGDAAVLSVIMSVQASAQALIAEAYFEALEEAVTETVDPALAGPLFTDNVIQFPIQKTV